MKLSSIGPRIRKAIEIHKYNKEQRFLNTFAAVDTNGISSETLKQLYPARIGIAKLLAEPNGVTVEIKGAKTLTRDIEHDSASLARAEERNENNLLVTVTDILHNKSKSRIVSGDTTATHIHSKPDYFVIDYADEGIQRTRLTSHDYEDDFLRNLYRNIESIIKEVKNSIRHNTIQ